MTIDITLSPEIRQFLTLKKSSSTQLAYQAAFKHFLLFYKQHHGKDATIEDFVNMIFDDLDKPLRKRQRIAEVTLSQFIDFLKKKRKSDNTIRLYISAMRHYLAWKDVKVSMKFVPMPRAKTQKQNKKHKWTLEQLRMFVQRAPNYRDKALILCLFQSGLSVTDLLDLNYGDIQPDFDNGTLPILLKLVRQKTQQEFITFLGRDAVHYLRLYLATRHHLTLSSPLFTKWNSDTERLTQPAIAEKFAQIAQALPFLNPENVNNGYNPVRAHSLRSGFNSMLMGKVDATLREFWMGHAIGPIAKAYFQTPDTELRDLYMTAEQYLAIEKTSRAEVLERQQKETKLPKETLEDIETLKQTVKILLDENKKLKQNLEDVENEFNEKTDKLRDVLRVVINREFDWLKQWITIWKPDLTPEYLQNAWNEMIKNELDKIVGKLPEKKNEQPKTD